MPTKIVICIHLNLFTVIYLGIAILINIIKNFLLHYCEMNLFSLTKNNRTKGTIIVLRRFFLNKASMWVNLYKTDSVHVYGFLFSKNIILTQLKNYFHQLLK